MAAISVRDLDEDVAARLKVQAARNGRSMEAEVRAILTGAVIDPQAQRPNLAQVIQQRSAAVGGADLHGQPRTDLPRAAELPA